MFILTCEFIDSIDSVSGEMDIAFPDRESADDYIADQRPYLQWYALDDQDGNTVAIGSRF